MTARSSPRTRQPAPNAASLVEAPDDLDELNRFFDERRWGDGLPIVPPTPERVKKMLSGVDRAAGEVVAAVAPGFGARRQCRLDCRRALPKSVLCRRRPP